MKLDFNYGARVLIPEGNYHVRLTDLSTSSILYDADVSNALVTSTKKYYIPFRVEVWKDGELALTHDLDLKGRTVHIRYPVGTLGDILAWFPYAEEFRKKGCSRRFVRAVFRDGVVAVPPGHSSGQLASAVGTNCLAEIPSISEPLPKESRVKVWLL